MSTVLYCLKKLAAFAVSLLVLSVVVFSIARLAPGDPLVSYYGDRAEKLPGLLKAAFFCLRLWALVREGRYRATKAELAQTLTGRERRILDMLTGEMPDDVDEAYSLLTGFASEALRQT